MYDGLSSNRDYDNAHQSGRNFLVLSNRKTIFHVDFISDLKPIDSSPESSSRSSGIYSANELHLSCSSSDLYSTNTNNKSFSSCKFFVFFSSNTNTYRHTCGLF